MRRLTLAIPLACLCLAAPAGAQTAPVATVDGVGEVTQAQFRHWMRLAARSARRERVPAEGTRAWRRLRDGVMQLLVQDLWLLGESRERGIVVTPAQVRRAFRREKRRIFRSEREFRRFLRDSGFTVRDVLFRIRLERRSMRIRRQVQREVPPPAPEEVRAHYDERSAEYVVPERRDVRWRLAPTRAAARSAIGRGRLERYAQEGRFPPVVFRARRGVARWRGRWLAFHVVRVRPSRQRPFEEVASVIRGVLRAQRQEDAVEAFSARFTERWRAATACREPYVAEEHCGRTTP